MDELHHIGEKQLLQRIKKYIGKSPRIVRAFSEDCAVIDCGAPGKYLLISVDAQICGIHFRSEYATNQQIGRKALTVNISDLAAMGGTPLFYLISIGAQPETPVQVIDELYEGMNSLAEETGALLVGGNVSESPVLFLDITVIGEVEKDEAIFRSGAKPGDTIFVSGLLGGSAAGLQFLKDGYSQDVADANIRKAIEGHLNPPSLSKIAAKIASWKLVTSMIDLSDGLGSDIAEICRESGVGAVIRSDQLPISESAKLHVEPLHLALHGGEDYHLLFTVSKREEFLARAASERLSFFEIGTIISGREIYLSSNGTRKLLEPGYEHFRNK